jgi:hypothetical protein
MLADPWGDYVLIAVAVGVIVVAAVLVWRTQLHRDGGDVEPGHILDRGWQFYFAPTTLEPPGTVFRIDAESRRYLVETLPVELQVGEEASGEHTESVTASMGVVARFLGLKGVEAKVGTGKTEQLVFRMDQPEREVVDDMDLGRVLQPFLNGFDYRDDNRYFVIRECRRATGLTHHLTMSQVNDLGGKASLKKAAALKGTLFKSERSGQFRLEKKFDKPMRVMFLPEEITPVSDKGASFESAELRLIPVTEVLAWEED